MLGGSDKNTVGVRYTFIYTTGITRHNWKFSISNNKSSFWVARQIIKHNV